jgi:hypothetical protein
MRRSHISLVASVLCLVIGAAVVGAEVVPVPGLYPSSDGQQLKLLVPESWTLIGTARPPNQDGANGHVAHGVTYTYIDIDGKEHRVNVTYCTGGE